MNLKIDVQSNGSPAKEALKQIAKNAALAPLRYSKKALQRASKAVKKQLLTAIAEKDHEKPEKYS
jgi:hypothetical protein